MKKSNTTQSPQTSPFEIRRRSLVLLTLSAAFTIWITQHLIARNERVQSPVSFPKFKPISEERLNDLQQRKEKFNSIYSGITDEFKEDSSNVAKIYAQNIAEKFVMAVDALYSLEFISVEEGGDTLEAVS